MQGARAATALCFLFFAILLPRYFRRLLLAPPRWFLLLGTLEEVAGYPVGNQPIGLPAAVNHLHPVLAIIIALSMTTLAVMTVVRVFSWNCKPSGLAGTEGKRGCGDC